MRVLGVDPGLSRCGVGVVEGPAHRPTPVRMGVVRTPTGQPTAQRLAALHGELRALVDEVRPDVMAVERVFFNANVRTAMGVGQAAGVALLCAAQAGLPVAEYTPTQVKLAVAGSGDADKDQVGFMVRTLLRVASTPRPADAADALALALCHLHHGSRQAPGAPAPGAPGPGAPGPGAPGPGAMSPRLAEALAESGPGAQVVTRRRP